MSGIEIIPGGPALPLPLVEALEAERLVCFCGAGISMGTVLPGFRRLTLEAIDRLDDAPKMTDYDPRAERRRMLASRFPDQICRFLLQVLGKQPLRLHGREKLTVLVQTAKQYLDPDKPLPVCLGEIERLL